MGSPADSLLAVRGLRLLGLFSDPPGDPPVHDVGFMVFADHDVGRFQVPVHHVAAVCVFQRVADLEQHIQPEMQRLFLIIGIDAVQPVMGDDLFQIAFEILAVHQLHRQMQAILAVGVQRINRHDRRMIQLGGDPRFRQEKAALPLPAGKLAPQGFDRHQPPQPAVEAAVKFPLPSLGELPAKLVIILDQVESLFVAQKRDLLRRPFVAQQFDHGTDIPAFPEGEDTE